MTQTDAEIVALGRYVVYGPGTSGDTDDMNEARMWLANDASGQARLYVQVNPQDDLVQTIAAAMCPPEASYCRERMIEEGDAPQIAAAVVAALTEAGRLVPPGLTLPKGEKVVGFCVDFGELQPFIGELDAEPTP